MNEGRRQYICDSSESRRRQYLYPIPSIFSCHCQFLCLEESDILTLVQGHEDRDKLGVLNPQMANFRFDAFGLVCVFILEDQAR